MPNLGLKDIPVQKMEEESLGLKDYADSLSEFIQQCETPLTIALQGDWGSGKTSLMNLIKIHIEGSEVKIHTVWFNTWQYSQFDMQGDLAISLISHFIDSLGTDENKTTKKLLRGLSKFGKAIAVGAGSLIGQADTVKDTIDQIESVDIDPAVQITKLKDNLNKIVEDKRAKEGKDRIVVFVDDLDRLLPEKAVELLEVFKLFLDIPHCVYVLACDYQVVTQGLKKKFGVGGEDLKGKSFFDKIIQLPFSMPLGQYKINDYIKNLLNRIGVTYEESDITLYVDMANYSVGFNPRSMKRLFNSLQLLNLVANKRNIFDEQDVFALKSEKQRIMFGALCLQTAYEPVYRFLQKNSKIINQELFEAFKDEQQLESDNRFDELRKELKIGSITDLRRLSQFMELFYESIQLKSDDSDIDKMRTLSQEEIKTLVKILSFSSLTSIDGAAVAPSMDYDERYHNRDMAKALIDEINTKYDVLLKKLGTEFVIYQPRKESDVSIYFHTNFGGKSEIIFGPNICFGKYWHEGKPYIGFWLSAQNKSSINAAKKWSDENLASDFPEYSSEIVVDFAELWLKEFDNPVSDEVVEQVKETIYKTLDKLLPKLIAYKEANV